MGTKQFGTVILLFLLLLLPASAQSQQAYLTSRTGTLGIRLDGGVSWSQGRVFANERISPASVVQPQGGVGLFFNFSPSFRLGLDYSYTRMLREQFDSTLKPLPGGGVESEAFRDLKMNFHGATVLAEYNVLGSVGSRLSLYVGAGAGFLSASGHAYTIRVKNEVKADGTGNTISITGHNEGHRYVAPCIPATLSLEYAFLPQVALSFGGGYRFIMARGNGYAPKGQAYATLGLRFNLSK